MSEKVTVSREEDGEDWFKALCERHNLRPAEPKLARDLRPGDYLFDVHGNPQKINSVKVFTHRVRATYFSHSESFPIETRFSLIALPKNCAPGFDDSEEPGR